MEEMREQETKKVIPFNMAGHIILYYYFLQLKILL